MSGVAAVRASWRPVAALLVAVASEWCAGPLGQGQQSSEGSRQPRAALFNPNPEHISNRLYRQVHVRSTSEGKEYGFEDLDPLLWPETKYLLPKDGTTSNQKTLELLDEFLRTRAEKQLGNDIKRAIFQRDLWAVFDWASSSNLAEKLGQVIWRLALSPAEIAALPDTYAMALRRKEFPAAYDAVQPERAFLPPDLFDANGPWVCVGASDEQLAAPGHAYHFSGRSVFLVFVRLPGGRQSTLAYLNELASLEIPLMVEEQIGGHPLRVWNPAVPNFPINTEFALIRKMVLPDQHHNLVLTPITESIQIRHYREIPPGTARLASLSKRSQSVSEIKLDRTTLFEGNNSGLRGVTKEDKEFPVFMTHGEDPFESNELEWLPYPSLESCTGCHLGPGIQSMMSLSFRGGRNPRLAEIAPADEAQKVISWKQKQRDWQRLVQLNSANGFVEPR